ncbi:DNA polymerase IV [Actinomyces vulturis]|uniref:DNA polymerase IV n=1 Tax=Actinomyces vulturis TaxID=1857645 RepID=UPI000832FB98|nr:DNA polymerase IV [Actinomyces vulturis]
MSRAPRLEHVRKDWGSDDSGAIIMHVDMDAFFASVEIRDHPELRGKPVIVGGSRASHQGRDAVDKLAPIRGVVSAASYEARAYGVNSAMPLGLALRRCPHAIVMPLRHRHYAQVSRQVMAILSELSPVVQQVSIDEAFVDLSGAVRRLGSPTSIAQRVRERIHREVGVSASVGLARNKSVAKIASSHAKPDGLLMIPDDATADFLAPLPVGALFGVGEKTAQRLEQWGITTVADVRATSMSQLHKLVGMAQAHHVMDMAWGRDHRKVESRREEKSVGTQSTFYEPLTIGQATHEVMLGQCHEVAERLRAMDVSARVVVVIVRWAEDFSTVTRSHTLAVPTDVARDLMEAAEALLVKIPSKGRVRLLGVRAEGLIAGGIGHQLTFDENPRHGLSERAADEVRRRWGASAIKPASLLSVPESDNSSGVEE